MKAWSSRSNKLATWCLALLVAGLLLSCVPPGVRLYEGPTLAASEVAHIEVETEMIELEGFVTTDGRTIEVARKPRQPLQLAPGRATFLVRSPEGVTDCSPRGTQLWKLAVEVRAGQAYVMSANARVFSVRVDASGSSCAASASIGPVYLQSKANSETVASAEKISDTELARLRSGQSPPRGISNAEAPTTVPESSAVAPAPSPRPEPEPTLATTEVSLVDFGSAQAPGRDRAKTSGSIVRVDARSAGRVHLRADDATAVLADGRRVPGALGFAIETAGEVNVVMLRETTVEGMTIKVHDKSYDAYGVIPRMAAHLGGVAGWAYDTAAGNALTLGIVFDCPSEQVRELEVLGSRLSVKGGSSQAKGPGDPASKTTGPTPKLTILRAKRQATLKVRRGTRPPFSEQQEPAPPGQQWLTVGIELSTTDPELQLPLRDIVLTDKAGHVHQLSWFGDSAEDAALTSVDEVTRESVSVFINAQGVPLYAVYPASAGTTLGFAQDDKAKRSPNQAPPTIRLALTFAVPRAKQRLQLKMGTAATVSVAEK